MRKCETPTSSALTAELRRPSTGQETGHPPHRRTARRHGLRSRRRRRSTLRCLTRAVQCQPELPFSASAQQAPPASTPPPRQAPPVRAPQASPPPLSEQQEQQVLLEAEEIASVRGMVPIDALPEMFPSRRRRGPHSKLPDADLHSCGEVNPAGNRFCETMRPCAASRYGQPAPAPSAGTALAGMRPPSRRRQRQQRRRLQLLPPAAALRKDRLLLLLRRQARSSGNRKLLIVLMVVLALGVGGVVYLMLRPSAKPGGTASWSPSRPLKRRSPPARRRTSRRRSPAAATPMSPGRWRKAARAERGEPRRTGRGRNRQSMGVTLRRQLRGPIT